MLAGSMITIPHLMNPQRFNPFNLKNATSPFTPGHRLPHTFSTLCSHFLPMCVGTCVMGLLVQRRDTRFLRIALLPLVVGLFFRASRIDLAKGNDYPPLRFLNTWFSMILFIGALRSAVWAFESEPYIRAPEAFSIRCNGILAQQLLSTLDLQFNLRGYGWNWGRVPYPGNETRSLTNRSAFIKKTLFALLLDIICLEQIYHVLELVLPSATVASAHVKASIFDASSLPQVLYARSLLLVTLFGFLLAANDVLFYDIMTLINVGLFRQPMFLWPPILSSPWRATSLIEFWGRRWHQLLRNLLLKISYPLYPIVGKRGGVVAIFFVTGVVHDIGLRGIGNGSTFWKVAGFFVMIGVGILLEISWKRVTGHRVDGWTGWVWCMSWMHSWGHLVIDGWVEHGLVAGLIPPELPRLSMCTPPLSVFQPLSTFSPGLPDQVYFTVGVAKVLIYVHLHPLVH